MNFSDNRIQRDILLRKSYFGYFFDPMNVSVSKSKQKIPRKIQKRPNILMEWKITWGI